MKLLTRADLLKVAGGTALLSACGGGGMSLSSGALTVPRTSQATSRGGITLPWRTQVERVQFPLLRPDGLEPMLRFNPNSSVPCFDVARTDAVPSPCNPGGMPPPDYTDSNSGLVGETWSATAYQQTYLTPNQSVGSQVFHAGNLSQDGWSLSYVSSSGTKTTTTGQSIKSLAPSTAYSLNGGTFSYTANGTASLAFGSQRLSISTAADGSGSSLTMSSPTSGLANMTLSAIPIPWAHCAAMEAAGVAAMAMITLAASAFDSEICSQLGPWGPTCDTMVFGVAMLAIGLIIQAIEDACQ